MRVQPLEEPESALGVGQRRRAGRRRVVAGVAGDRDPPCEGLDRRMVEQIADGRAGQPRRDLGGQQRVAAQREEVVVRPHLGDAEHLGEHGGDARFGVVRGGT